MRLCLPVLCSLVFCRGSSAPGTGREKRSGYGIWSCKRQKAIKNDLAFSILYLCIRFFLLWSKWIYDTCSAPRLSGDIDEVNALKIRCEQWIEPTSCTDAHTPASLLKLWYRQLCNPVIPDNMYDECIESCFDADSSVRLVHKLPPFNRLVFSYLIRFLQVYHSNSFLKVRL